MVFFSRLEMLYPAHFSACCKHSLLGRPVSVLRAAMDSALAIPAHSGVQPVRSDSDRKSRRKTSEGTITTASAAKPKTKGGTMRLGTHHRRVRKKWHIRLKREQQVQHDRSPEGEEEHSDQTAPLWDKNRWEDASAAEPKRKGGTMGLRTHHKRVRKK